MKKVTRKGILMSAVRISCLVVAGALLLDVGCVNAFMFFPPEPGYGEGSPGYHDIGTNGVRVAAIVHEAEPRGKVLLYCHGNAEELAEVMGSMKGFLTRGLSIAGVDYPGYGLSDGSPTEEGCYGTVHRLYDWLREERGYKPEDIIVFGFSIGSGPAIELATTRPVGGLILEAPFVSATRVVTRVRILPVDPFPNIDRIADVTCPVLILHGDSDTLIGQWHGRELYEKATAPKRFVSVPGANHNDVAEVYGVKRYLDLLSDFALQPQRSGPDLDHSQGNGKPPFLTLPELRMRLSGGSVEKSFWLKLLSGETSVDNLPPHFLLLPSASERQTALEHALTYGGYPAVSDKELPDAERWLRLTNRSRTYLERELRVLVHLRDLEPFLKLRHAAALNTAGVLNGESIAREVGMTAKTIRRYLQYLSIGHQSILLEAWSRNPRRRLMKAPKIHFLDQGVLQVVLGKRGGLTGAEFESFAVSEIYKQCHQLDLPVSFYHLRSYDGSEVDLLVETPEGYYAFEMKMSEHVSPTDARHLRALPEILDKPLLHGFVLSRDPETKRLADNITAVHIAVLLG